MVELYEATHSHIFESGLPGVACDRHYLHFCHKDADKPEAQIWVVNVPEAHRGLDKQAKYVNHLREQLLDTLGSTDGQGKCLRWRRRRLRRVAEAEAEVDEELDEELEDQEDEEPVPRETSSSPSSSDSTSTSTASPSITDGKCLDSKSSLLLDSHDDEVTRIKMAAILGIPPLSQQQQRPQPPQSALDKSAIDPLSDPYRLPESPSPPPANHPTVPANHLHASAKDRRKEILAPPSLPPSSNGAARNFHSISNKQSHAGTMTLV